MTSLLVFLTFLTAFSKPAQSTRKPSSDVGNGVETKDIPAVVPLQSVLFKDNGEKLIPEYETFCTGFLVNNMTVITAAHCLRSEMELKNGFIGINGNTFVTSGFYIHKDYLNKDSLQPDISHDLGIIKIPRRVTLKDGTQIENPLEELEKLSTLNFAKHEPKKNEKVLLIGYGLNQLSPRSGAGIKRKGTQSVNYVKNGLIVLNEGQSGDVYEWDSDRWTFKKLPEGVNVSCLNGDSGSPLLSISENSVYGVCSSMHFSPLRVLIPLFEKQNESKYVSVNEPSNRKFIFDLVNAPAPTQIDPEAIANMTFQKK